MTSSATESAAPLPVSDADLKMLESLRNAERIWESAMMNAVGEDGPASVVEAIESLKLQRDTAWRELLEVRKFAGAKDGESAIEAIKRVISSVAEEKLRKDRAREGESL